MSAKPFDGAPFVAGSLFGLRAFKVDALGLLTGVVHKSVWRPGENEAECFAPVKPADVEPKKASTGERIECASGGYITLPNRHTLGPPWSIYPSSFSQYLTIGEPAYRPDDHRFAMVGCTCGFYAYFNGSNEYAGYDESHTISGIVEGYGPCTVGSEGFRSSKARIVALVIDEPKTPKHLIRHELLRQNYPEISTVATELEAVRRFPLTRPDDVPNPSTDADFWTRDAS